MDRDEEIFNLIKEKISYIKIAISEKINFCETTINGVKFTSLRYEDAPDDEFLIITPPDSFIFLLSLQAFIKGHQQRSTQH